MNWNRTLLAKLFFGFVNLKLRTLVSRYLILLYYWNSLWEGKKNNHVTYLTNKVNESFPWLWNSLFRPVSELELSDSPTLSISCICHLQKNVFIWNSCFVLSCFYVPWILSGCTVAYYILPRGLPQNIGI